MHSIGQTITVIIIIIRRLIARTMSEYMSESEARAWPWPNLPGGRLGHV